MNTLPEPVQFYLDTCDRVLSRGMREGIEVLPLVERTVFRAYVFFCEEQNGSLSQFFANSDCSSEIAEQTAAALDCIGVPKAAAVVRSAAAVVCRSDAKSFVGTWGGYLAQADPLGHLDVCCKQMQGISEEVPTALEAFILRHRRELEIGAAGRGPSAA